MSPIPGSIIEIRANIGDKIKQDEVVFVIEAMKMENDIVAPIDGIVKEIKVVIGQTVEVDKILAVIE
jgi:biotin carboxyl carrier protein